jgi:hypothetical protein
MNAFRFVSENPKGTTTYSALLEQLTPEEVEARLAYKRRQFPDWKHSAEEVDVRKKLL